MACRKMNQEAAYAHNTESGCKCPALSVLVMLVSQNVFHVVLALQSIVFIHFLG